MARTLTVLHSLLLALALLATGTVFASSRPPGFNEFTVGSNWNGGAVGIAFDSNGRLYVTERAGRVWLVVNGVKSGSPLVDISDEVGAWRDFGLLGFALDPAFYSNGYVYLYYVVDRHHLDECSGVDGPPNCSGAYDPGRLDDFEATIGRITRYRAVKPSGDPDYRNATTVNYNSRKVLLGETAATGVPILHQSHGTGALIFGTDGSLIASAGDGASYSSVDIGSASETYYQDALNIGIIGNDENIGAWRAQYLNSHNGKLLRLDPNTGNGLASNPFYDAGDPRSARSRTFAFGLRNPYRITLRPDTGSHLITSGDPGRIYVGDVGWKKWEDLQVTRTAGENFGWPYFEGLQPTDDNPDYDDTDTQNLAAPNPLFGSNGCTLDFFRFRDLAVQEVCPTCSPSWPNPCDAGVQITSEHRSVHARPLLDWRHGQSVARVPIFNSGGFAAELSVGANLPAGAQGVAATGNPFPGNASTGGVWYTGTSFPPEYQDTYFHADFGGQWIRNLEIDANDNVTAVNDFLTNGGGIVALAVHPQSGDLYYVSWASTIYRIEYAGDGNVPPTAAAAITQVNGQAWSATAAWGDSPLTVMFDSSGSSDPDFDPLSYLWDFGDGSQSSDPNPTHVFDPAGQIASPQSYTVTLTVSDGEDQAQAQLIVSINNTPPSAVITQPSNGDHYSAISEETIQLQATFGDIETSTGNLNCEWVTHLHHDDHFHSEPADNNCATSTVISPLGCGDETYYFRIEFTATDPQGLAGHDEVEIYPDCDGISLNADAGPDISEFDIDGNGDQDITLDGTASTDPDSTIVSYEWLENGVVIATGALATVNLAVGEHDVTLKVTNAAGRQSFDFVLVTVLPAGNQPPVAAFSATPGSGLAPLNSSFDAGNSSDPDGSIVSYAWDFGDGATASGMLSSHTFTDPGTYTVTLTVTDDGGATDTQTTLITVASQWWNLDWTRQRTLTIDNSTGGETLTNFPLLVTLDATRIDYGATRPGGADLRFVAEDGFTVLDHEIERWDPAGTSIIWVKVPQVAAGSLTNVSLYYGNAGASDGQNAAGVWSNGYAGVWHLDGSTLDSTANANHGTAFGATPATGRIGGAYSFNGSNQYIDAGNDASLAVDNALTIEAWVFVTSTSGSPRVLSKKINWRDGNGYNVEYKPSLNQIGMLGSGDNVATAANVPLNGAWHYLAAINNNGSAALFVDGINETTDSGVSPLNSGSAPLHIGRRAGGSNYFGGLIDELRISSVARSGGWLDAQHRAMNDSLITYGDETQGDTQTPSATLTSPADGAIFTAPADITLTASASDPDGSVVSVTFFADGQQTGIDFDSPYSIDWAGVGAGSYALTARATDNEGRTGDSEAVNITVNPPPTPPTITDQPDDISVNEGSTASFFVAASGSAPLTFQWRRNGADIGGATGPSYTTPPNTLGDSGNAYSVTISNNAGSATSNDAILTVVATPNSAPAANAGPDQSATTGVTLHIEGTASDDGLPNPPSLLTTNWSQLSGPATATYPLGDQNQPHVHVDFPVAGTYVLRLTADDSDLSASDDVTVIVTDPPNAPPTALFSAVPSSGVAPLVTSFDATASSDSDGNIVDYAWDFGDGSTASGVTASHTYSLGGNYTATLTVTDNDGDVDSKTATISVNDGWWDLAWARQREVFIDNSAGSEALSNFPLLVLLTPASIDYAVTAAGGADLRFLASDNTTVLDHEIESWNPGGTSAVWVRIPTLAAASSSVYLYYGNATAPDNQNAAGVWGAPYRGVWHLNNNALDSTGNGNHGTAFGATPAAGRIAGGFSFNGSSHYIDAGNDASLAVTGAITMEAWINSASSGGSPRILSKKNGWRDTNGYNMELKPVDGEFNMLGSGSNAARGNGGSLTGNWHYVTAVNNGGTARLYVDGVEVTTDGDISGLAAGSTALNFGRRAGGADYFAGIIDELRVAAVARSADWIAAQNRVLNDQVVTFGPEFFSDNAPPAVALTGPADGSSYIAPASITLSATASDSDGSIDRVEFFAGNTLIGSDTTAPYGYTWTDVPVGNYALTARAVDDESGTATSAVSNVAVTPEPEPAQVTIDLPTDGSTVTGPDVTVTYTLAGEGYNHLHLTLDEPPHVTIMDLNGSYTFTGVAAGSHTITAQLVSGDHQPLTNPEAVDSVTFAVVDPPNTPPAASFSATPGAGSVPLAVTFDGTGSSDSDGTIVSFAWTFGDGATASGSQVTHTYSAAGTYTATLTVTDDDGATDSTSMTINAVDDWWNANWTERLVMTLDNAASTVALTDFPLLVTLTPARFDYAVAGASGQDLRFVDADGVTVLDHEIDSWNAGGTSTVWVRIPLLDAGSTTDSIALYYGNPSASDNQAPAGVWSNGYAAVWHLGSDTLDVTGNANHGTAFGAAPAAGRIGGAYTFNGSGDYIDAGSSASLAITGAITMEAWVNLASTSGSPRILSKKNGWRDSNGYNMELKPSEGEFNMLGSGSNAAQSAAPGLNGSWHYLVAINDNGNARLYLDGVEVTTDSSVSGLAAGGTALSIGRRSGNANYFGGLIDELRISGSARSADWVAAQQRSMTDAMISYTAQ